MTTETTTEQARELAERLDALLSEFSTCGCDDGSFVLIERSARAAATALRSLADQVERLKSQKWDVQHTDTANTAVQLGLARDSAEAEVAALAKERDALKKANAEGILLIDEINEQVSSRQFYGIDGPLISKLYTIRATLARAALNAGGER